MTRPGRYGLSSGRFGLLLTLFAADEPCLVPSEIADRLGVTRPTVTNLVGGLLDAGLVERVVDESSLRNRPVALTAKGRRTIEGAATDHFHRVAAATASLTRSEREVLEAAFALIGRYCDALHANDREVGTSQ